MRRFVKINPSRNGEITLSFTDIGKFCHCHKLLRRIRICLFTLFTKISEFTVPAKVHVHISMFVVAVINNAL